MIDSHCHLTSMDLSLFNHDVGQILADAAANGVTHCLSVCVEREDVPQLVALANQYPNVFFSVGEHPSTITNHELDEDTLVNLAAHPACIAIGETGLDYANLTSEAEKIQQQQRFRTHIRAALKTSKPLIIHTRAAQADTIRLLQEEGAACVGGVMHCFTESWEMAAQALNLGFYISYSGIVTFKNATLVREVACKIPADRLLIETDAPYLAPVPYRGKANRPAWVKYTAETLAALRGVSLESLVMETTANFYRCFRVTPV